jgi:hypothetical protein
VWPSGQDVLILRTPSPHLPPPALTPTCSCGSARPPSGYAALSGAAAGSPAPRRVSAWACEACTTLNSSGAACAVCGSARPAMGLPVAAHAHAALPDAAIPLAQAARAPPVAAAAPAVASAARPHPAATPAPAAPVVGAVPRLIQAVGTAWQCQQCTFENLTSVKACGMCGSAAPAPPPTATALAGTQSAPPGSVYSDAVRIPPPMIPDSMSPGCHSCQRTFTFLTRQHHCRCCGQAFCSSCRLAFF